MNNNVFKIVDNELVIKETDEVIPFDEPVFILLARDSQAASTIRVYQSLMAPTNEGWKIIQSVFDDFAEFRQENPDSIVSPEEAYS